MNSQTRRELSCFLDEKVRELKIPHTICACTENHKMVYHHTAGAAAGEAGDESVFHLYSATKVITAVAAMQMVEKGLLEIDAPVSDYIPEYGTLYIGKGKKRMQASKVLTVEHLITMQAGFDYILHTPEVDRIIRETDGKADTRRIAAGWAGKDLRFEPGTHFMYSICHDILGGVLEAACGMTIGEWMRKFIFDPLDMKTISFAPDASMFERMMPLWRLQADGTITAEDNRENFCRLTPYFESCGGGLFGTLSDLVRFTDAMACGGRGANGAQILKSETIEQLGRNRLGPQSLNDYRNRYPRGGYGYGWGVRVSLGEGTAEPAGTFGWDGAAGAHIMIDPVNHVSMVYLQHVLGMDFLYDHVFDQLDAILNREQGRAGNTAALNDRR